MPKDPNAKPALIDELLDDTQDIEVPADDDTPLEKKEIDVDAEDENDKEFKKLDNKAFAALRKEAADAKREREELRKKVTDYEKAKTNPSAPVNTQPVQDPNRRRETIGGIVVPETKAEWDALARQDWQSAVDLRSIINARKVQEEVRRVDTATRSLDESKNKVLQRHPELADATTDKGKIYLNILEKNPEYLTMNKGPILAMRDMEDEMEALGYTKEQIFDTKKASAQNETTRVNRGALTNSGRTPERTGRTVQLSKDDMEFCKTQGIDPVDYAKQKLELENNKKGG